MMQYLYCRASIALRLWLALARQQRKKSRSATGILSQQKSCELFSTNRKTQARRIITRMRAPPMLSARSKTSQRIRASRLALRVCRDFLPALAKINPLYWCSFYKIENSGVNRAELASALNVAVAARAPRET